MINHIINPIGPPKKTKRKTKHPDLPLSAASDEAHILAKSPIKNQIKTQIKKNITTSYFKTLLLFLKKLFYIKYPSCVLCL